jgi:hypothetical protein
MNVALNRPHLPLPSALLLLLAAAGSIRAVEPNQDGVIDLGARRELMVDSFLSTSNSGLELRLHTPTPCL